MASAAGQPAGADGPRDRTPVSLLIVACLAVSALTLLLPSTPTYDPWAWILWGREIIHLDLLTTGGPSWKPLPVLFTTPFAIFGEDAAPMLWVWVARAGGLLALVLAFRLARRLTGPGIPGIAAGVLAVALLATSYRYVRDSALGNSEPLLAALLLWGFERHIDGRRDHALYLGVAAALLRPEVWPFLGLYGLWLFVREPRFRLPLVGFAGLVAALWFVPEWIGSGDPLRASSRANTPNPGSPAFAENPGLEVVRQFSGVTIDPLKLAALVGTGFGLHDFIRHRRGLPVLAVAAFGAAWLGLVALMTQGGYAGNPRYLIATTVALCVLGAFGVGRSLALVIDFATSRLGGRPRLGLAAAAAVVVLGLLVTLPISRTKVEDMRDLGDQLEYEADLYGDLRVAIDEAGGPDRLRACGYLATGAYQTQMVAWVMDLHGYNVGWKQTPAPGAAFQTRNTEDGPYVVEPTDDRYRPITETKRWRIFTLPPDDERRAACPAASPDAPKAPLTDETPFHARVG